MSFTFSGKAYISTKKLISVEVLVSAARGAWGGFGIAAACTAADFPR